MLIHATNALNATSILRENKLSPGKGENGQGEKGDSRSKVYLQYILHRDVGRNLNDYAIVDSWDENVFLVMDESILRERSDYHMTVGWEYGNFVEGRSFSKQNFKRFVTSLANKAPDPTNEIVFSSEISLDKYMTAIWIGKDVSNKEAAVLREVSTKGVPILRTTFVPGDVVDLS